MCYPADLQPLDHSPLQQITRLASHPRFAGSAEEIDARVAHGSADQACESDAVAFAHDHLHLLSGRQCALHALELFDIGGRLKTLARLHLLQQVSEARKPGITVIFRDRESLALGGVQLVTPLLIQILSNALERRCEIDVDCSIGLGSPKRPAGVLPKRSGESFAARRADIALREDSKKQAALFDVFVVQRSCHATDHFGVDRWTGKLAYRSPSYVRNAGFDTRCSRDENLRHGDYRTVASQHQATHVARTPAYVAIAPCLVQIRIVESGQAAIPLLLADPIDFRRERRRSIHLRAGMTSDRDSYHFDRQLRIGSAIHSGRCSAARRCSPRRITSAPFLVNGT